MKTLTDTLYALSLFASLLFSLFMMYSMYKTKKGVEKISENATKLTDTLSEQINNLPEIITSILNPKATNQSLDYEDSPAFNQLVFKDIFLDQNNFLLKSRNAKDGFITSKCCGSLITINNLDQLLCNNCQKEVNEKGEIKEVINTLGC